MKKRPTRSLWLPRPSGRTLFEASRRRAFSMPPAASTKIRAAGQRLHLQAAHFLYAVGFDINGICIEIHCHMFRSRQLFPVKSAETHGGAELRDSIVDPASCDRDSANLGVTDRI